MKAASLKQIREAILLKNDKEVNQILNILIKYKKENKELATYLLFYADQEQEYVNDVKLILDEEFKSVNTSNHYFAKKGLRKVIRLQNKYIKYTNDPVSGLEIYLFVIGLFSGLSQSLQKNLLINKMITNQKKKIYTLFESLHPDLQYDYQVQINNVSSPELH